MFTVDRRCPAMRHAIEIAALGTLAMIGACGPPGAPTQDGDETAATQDERAPRLRAASNEPGQDGSAARAAPEPMSPEAEGWLRDLFGDDEVKRGRALVHIHEAKDPRIAHRLATIAADMAREENERFVALEGLRACGAAAEGEVATVAPLLDDRWSAGLVAGCLKSLRPAGRAELIAALGPTRSHRAHQLVAGSLQWDKSDGADAIPALLRVLRECPAAVEPMPRTDREKARSTLANEDRCTCREKAAEALGGIGVAAPGVIEALTLALERDDRDVREKAAEALGKLGPEGVSILVARLPTASDWYTRAAITRALADTSLDREDVVAALFVAARSRDVAWYAVAGLSKVRTPEVAALLREHVRDPHWKTRRLAMEKLAEIGDLAHDAIPDIRTLLDSPEEDTAEHAVRALDKLGVLTREEADRALESTNEEARTAAATIVVRRASVAELVAWAADPADLRHDRAVGALGRHPDADAAAIPVLLSVAHGKDERIAVNAVGSLGALGPAAGPALAALLDDPACTASGGSLVRALGRSRWPGATPILVTYLGRRDDGSDAAEQEQSREQKPYSYVADEAAAALLRSGAVPRGDEPQLRLALRSRRELWAAAGAVCLIRSGSKLDDAETTAVVRALERGWQLFRDDAPASVEMLTALARLGPRAADVLPELRLAERGLDDGPTREAMRAAIAAIEAAPPPPRVGPK